MLSWHKLLPYSVLTPIHQDQERICMLNNTHLRKKKKRRHKQFSFVFNLLLNLHSVYILVYLKQ